MIRELISRLEELIIPDRLPPEMQQLLQEAAQPRFFKQGDYLLRRGEVCQGAHLLIRGLARSFYVNEDKEITSRLMENGFIITSWISFYTQHPASEFIVALEDSYTVYLQYKDIQQLYRKFPLFNEIGRKQVEYSFFKAEQRTQMLRGLSAAERYEKFCEMHPDLLRRVPLKYIASYLGMTDVTLSRLRGNYKRKLVS